MRSSNLKWEIEPHKAEIVESIALDVGVPISCGGDPGPAGAAAMLQCSLIEGMGDNLPAARIYAKHQSAISCLLKHGTQSQKDAACLGRARKSDII